MLIDVSLSGVEDFIHCQAEALEARHKNYFLALIALLFLQNRFSTIIDILTIQQESI